MHPEAVEGLLEEGVLAEGGFSLEAATAVGAGKQACWQRHGVHQREGRVVGGEREELLPEALLYLPEVGTLTGEGGAVHLAKGWEPLGVVSAEEEVDSLVGVEAKELPDDLYGEDLRIRKLRSGTALADATPFESVVDKAEDGHDEGAKIHEKKSSVMFGAIELTPRVGRSSPWLNSSRETCTRGKGLYRISGRVRTARSSGHLPLAGQPAQKPGGQLRVQRGLSLAHPPHGFDDLLLRRVLEYVASRPRLQRFEQVVGVFVHGHHEDANLGVSLLDLLCSRQAVHDMHPNVHEDQIRPETRAQQERLPSVGRLANDLHVGLVGERVLEALPGELMVVDYGQAQWPAYVLWRDLGSHLSIHPR